MKPSWFVSDGRYRHLVEVVDARHLAVDSTKVRANAAMLANVTREWGPLRPDTSTPFFATCEELLAVRREPC